jgi:hypothetical protein
MANRAYGGRMRFTVALAAAAALLAGCGGGDGPPVETAEQATACELHLSGGPVFVRFAGKQAADRCDNWIRGGSTWSRTKRARARGDFRRVCVLYRERTAAGLYAADGIAPREQALRVCGSLLDRGWRELSSPADAPGWEQRVRDQPAPNRFSAVRCSEGLCRQRGELVARPQAGARCGPGRRWTFKLGAQAAAGVFRCRLSG